MKLKDYEKEIGHSVAEMSYEEMLRFLEINQDESTRAYISYANAYWLGKHYQEKDITADEYTYGLSVLREAIIKSKNFGRCYVEAEDPTGKEKDHWEFYIKDY